MSTALPGIDFEKFFMDLPSPHIIVRPDQDLTIVSQNNVHADITFVPKGAVIGKPLLVAFPDTSEKFKKTGISDLAESFKKVAKTGKPDVLPVIRYDIAMADGMVTEKWWKVTHYPIFEENGQVQFVYQSTEDVTHDIKIKHELEQTENMLNTALELGLVSTWSWDMKNDKVLGDINLARSFGVTAERAMSGLPIKTFIDSIYPADRAKVSRAIDKTIKDGSIYNIDYRTVNAKGDINWVIARGRVYSDENGMARFFNGVLIDITDRKEAEARLAEVERRYKALFDSKVVAIANVNMDGTVLDANKTFFNLFGYKKNDLKNGLKSKELSLVADDVTTIEIYNSLKTKGESEPVRKEYKRKDGTHFTGLVGAAMLPKSSNEFMAFIIDVSEAEKLRKLNTVKDEFIAMASHQLRTPASTVKQYLGILIEEYYGELNENQLQFATIANNANNRQITIIEDLLKTAQIDIEGYELLIEETNVEELVREVIAQYEPLLDSKDQTVTLRSKDSNVTAMLDKSEIAICIANLIENASKYSDIKKNIEVSISKTLRKLSITVKDEGVGIAESNYTKIFSKFTRVDNRLSDTVTGNGLGLYWVKRIVELHNGTIKIDSHLGKGTSISIVLPI